MYCDNGLQQSSLWVANTCIPPFLNTYPILLHTSKPFLVSFPLSGCPSPLHHLANSFNIHDKCQLHYEPFPSLTPTSHSKQSAAPRSAPLTLAQTSSSRCMGIVTSTTKWELRDVFSLQLYHPPLAHGKCSTNSWRKNEEGREGEKKEGKSRASLPSFSFQRFPR